MAVFYHYSLFEQVLCDSSVKNASDLCFPAGTVLAKLQADCEDIRYTMDSTTIPTQTLGMLLKTTQKPKMFLIGDVRRIKFTRGSVSNAALKVHYYYGKKLAGMMSHLDTCDSAMMAVINGLTYSISDALTGVHGTGTHWHASNVPMPPPPSLPVGGYAEVGGFFGDEECRGLSEFDLSGLPASVTTATVKFQVADMVALGVTPGPPENGLFDQGTLADDVDVEAYEGSNAEELADYAATSTNQGTFDTTGLLVDDLKSFDVTAYVNTLLGAAKTSLGIRLQMSVVDRAAEAMTFDRFVLEVTW